MIGKLLLGSGWLAFAAMAILVWWQSTREPRPLALPPSTFVFDPENNRLIVTGTWQAVDDTQAWQNQVTSFDCLKDIGLCWEATAVVADEQLLPLNLQTLVIDNWDQDRVVVSAAEGVCKRSVYEFDLVAKVASAAITPAHGSSEACRNLDRTTMHLVLIDGYARYKKQMRNWYGLGTEGS